MNKRKLETENKIKSAYLTMLQNKEVPNIRAICRMVNINKSTFYRHYEYLGQLETQIKQEMAHRIFDELIQGSMNSTIDREYLSKCLDWINNLTPAERMIVDSRDEILFDEYRKVCFNYFQNYIKDPVVILYTIYNSYLALRVFCGNLLSEGNKLKYVVAIMKIFTAGFDEYQKEYQKDEKTALTIEDMYQKEDDEQTLKEIQEIIFGNRF